MKLGNYKAPTITFPKKSLQSFLSIKAIQHKSNTKNKLKTEATDQSMAETQRYAVVTGGNKGIGFEICRQLAGKGFTVVLGSRSEKRGNEAVEKLKELGVDNVVFHQLDVTDAASVAAAADFVKTKFGKLDLLVNNAGISGVEVEGDVEVLAEALAAVGVEFAAQGSVKPEPFVPKANGKLNYTYELAKDSVEINYYGPKRTIEAFVPLLQKSDSPRIVNVSSTIGSLVLLINEWAKEVFSNEDSLTEEKIDEVVEKFIKDFKEGKVEEKDWPTSFAAYKVTKAALNAYTKFLSKKYPNICIIAVCPGHTRSDITYNAGPLSTAEAAEIQVKMALIPPFEGLSGSFFHRWESSAL